MDLFDRESRRFFHTYKRLPLQIERGEGMYLFTKDGRRYLDMFSGLAVNDLGYGHPAVLRAIREQSERYIHLSNYYLQEPQVALAELLAKHSGYPRVFFCNSGTEAIEGSIKISRKWGSKHGRTEIVSFSNSFHGRTMGALSMMDRPSYREGFGPFLQNFRTVEFNDANALRKSINERTAAVVLEFIQGEGGVCPVDPGFAAELAALKKKFSFLLVADEIQSGIGRTGKFFAFQHYRMTPDVVTVAKPIGGGLPLGAILASEEAAGVLEPGMHGTTFGGNPVACAAGAAVIREIMEGGLIANAEAMGRLLKAGLTDLQGEFPELVKDVRGFGLMLGMELSRECDGLVSTLRERGILLNCTAQRVVRFLPPLIVGETHINTTIAELRTALRAM